MSNRVFFAVFFALLLCADIACADMFLINYSDATPASFFNSGIEGYYFSSEGLSVLKYANDKFYYDVQKEKTYNISGDFSITAENVFKDMQNIDVMLLPDGNVKLFRIHDSYECPDNHVQNCLYGDVIINSIEVKNLAGNSNDAFIQKITHQAGKKIKFALGSKIYSFGVIFPSFDFDNFYDFDSLICSKNTEGACRGVINEGKVDKIALFELVKLNENFGGLYFSKANENLAYLFDIKNNIVSPYNVKCVENLASSSDFRTCRESGLKDGTIVETRHPSGMVYWFIDFNNDNLDSDIFWVGSAGEPFKAHTNRERNVTIKMFNKTAADTVASQK